MGQTKKSGNSKPKAIKMKIIIFSIALLIGGCSMIPSFWDDNEAYAVAKIRHSVDVIDCDSNYVPQVNVLVSDIRFLQLYSESKGSQDLSEMISPMMKTAKGLQKMTVNETFCRLKKKQLVKQSAIIADSAMERF
jgi:hypothetical protein